MKSTKLYKCDMCGNYNKPEPITLEDIIINDQIGNIINASVLAIVGRINISKVPYNIGYMVKKCKKGKITIEEYCEWLIGYFVMKKLKGG